MFETIILLRNAFLKILLLKVLTIKKNHARKEGLFFISKCNIKEIKHECLYFYLLQKKILKKKKQYLRTTRTVLYCMQIIIYP